LSALKIGYYCDIWLDTYYIPGKPGHGKTHTTHGLLIYGYDAAIQSFKTLTYTDTGKYEDLIVLVENLAAACSNDFFSHINLLKNEINTVVKYDIHIIREKLKKYIDSECYDDNMRYSKKSSEQYYNYNASWQQKKLLVLIKLLKYDYTFSNRKLKCQSKKCSSENKRKMTNNKFKFN